MAKAPLADRARAAQQQREQAEGSEPEPGTAVAERDPRTLDTGAFEMLSSWATQLGQALAPGQNLDHFLRMTALLLATSKQAAQLVACDRPSLYKAVAQCAHYGLLPDGKLAAIVPYGKEATFLPMKDGFVQLAFNTGQIRGIECGLIYRKDEWAEEIGPQGRGFILRPRRFEEVGGDLIPVDRARIGPDFRPLDGPGKDNPPILAYCYALWRDGSTTAVEFMTAQEAIDIRDRYSKAFAWAEEPHYGKPAKRDSFWHTDPDRAWMKSVLRRAMHHIPKSAALIELILADDAAESRQGGVPVAWQPPPMPQGGPAVAWEGDVTHDPDAIVAGTVEPEPAEIDRGKTMRHLWALFKDAGWDQTDEEEASNIRHLAISAIYNAALGGPTPPVEVTSITDLDDEALAAVTATLAEQLPKAKDAHKFVADLASAMAQALAEAEAKPKPAPRRRPARSAS